MEDNKREIGGSKLSIWYGKLLGKIAKRYQRRSDKFISKGNKTIVLNPTCKFVNPFILLFSFTVDNTEKYQLVHQGGFKDKYKAWREKCDEYLIKKDAYEVAFEEYDALENKEGVDAPTVPVKISDSPIDTAEMFMIILPKKKSWYKKI